MDWLMLLITVVLAGVGAFALYVLVTRFHTVPEGHVAIIQRLDKFERTAGPGLYAREPNWGAVVV